MNNVLLISFMLFQIVAYSAKMFALEIIDGRAILERNEAVNIFYKNNIKSYVEPIGNKNSYERINGIIREIHGLYAKEISTVIPNFLIPPVPIVLVVKDIKNAFVRELIVSQKGVFTPNVIIVGEKLFSSNELYATIAHEMSHYFLKHSSRRDGDKFTSYYTQNDDCFICEQTLGVDEELDGIFNSLFYLRVHLSDLHPLDFKNVPLENSNLPNRLPKLLNYISRSANPKLESCNIYIDEKKSIENILLSRSTLLFNRIELTKTEHKMINSKLENLKSNGIKCFKDADSSLFDDAFKHVFFQDLDQIRTNLQENPEIFVDLNDFLKGYYTIMLKNNNPFIKILNLNKYISNFEKELTILTEDFDRNQYRHITTEDEADMLMQAILLKNGKENEIRDFFKLDVLNSEDPESCLTSDLKRLPQENIYSIHHSNCFRYHRYMKLNEELKTPNTHNNLIQFLISSKNSFIK